jgi:hypothetical protein
MLNKMELTSHKNEPDFYEWLFTEYPDFYKILDREIYRICINRIKMSNDIIDQYKEYFEEYCDAFEIKVIC